MIYFLYVKILLERFSYVVIIWSGVQDTDGYGDVPEEVVNFLLGNSQFLKGVIVSGDMGYGDAYCQAGDKIAEDYDVEVLYRVENAGTPEDLDAMKAVVDKL